MFRRTGNSGSQYLIICRPRRFIDDCAVASQNGQCRFPRSSRVSRASDLKGPFGSYREYVLGSLLATPSLDHCLCGCCFSSNCPFSIPDHPMRDIIFFPSYILKNKQAQYVRIVKTTFEWTPMNDMRRLEQRHAELACVSDQQVLFPSTFSCTSKPYGPGSRMG